MGNSTTGRRVNLDKQLQVCELSDLSVGEKWQGCSTWWPPRGEEEAGSTECVCVCVFA